MQEKGGYTCRNTDGRGDGGIEKIEEVEEAVEGTSDFKSFLNAFVTEKIVKAKGEGLSAEEFKAFFEDAIKIK